MVIYVKAFCEGNPRRREEEDGLIRLVPVEYFTCHTLRIEMYGSHDWPYTITGYRPSLHLTL